jgi:hypothetical protein
VARQEGERAKVQNLVPMLVNKLENLGFRVERKGYWKDWNSKGLF